MRERVFVVQAGRAAGNANSLEVEFRNQIFAVKIGNRDAQNMRNRTIGAVENRVRNNLFDTYSMAAFEYRAQMMIDSSFTGNVCKNAGCGFGMLGESLPRRSEIWPQPMGHHIFLWRIWSAPDGGSLLIADNQFVDAPNGAAVYSIICPEAEAQVTFRSNRYEGRYLMKAYFGGKETELT